MAGQIDEEIRAALESADPAEAIREIAAKAFEMGRSHAASHPSDPRFSTLADEIAAKVPSVYREALAKINDIAAALIVEALDPAVAVSQINELCGRALFQPLTGEDPGQVKH